MRDVRQLVYEELLMYADELSDALDAAAEASDLSLDDVHYIMELVLDSRIRVIENFTPTLH